MSLPKILVIDDQFGQHLDARRDLCAMFGLDDITGDDTQPEIIKNSLAATFFCSGQKKIKGTIENSVEVAIDAVRQGWPFQDWSRWALVLLDLRFVSGKTDSRGKPEGRSGDDSFGLKILEVVKNEFPDLPVVILSSRDRGKVIEDCRKLGAADFIQRHPASTTYSPREILASKLREYGLIEDERGIIAGRSLSLLKTLASARRAATGGGNILLLGETGTGKELLARYIHKHSPKSAGPYVVFDSHGTAETLQEDQLFGHIKGAFTDAKADRAGVFEQANGGTLFIDEVGDIPESLQNKLLRPIEGRRVIRQGENSEREVNVQVILATNKALDEFTATGRFKFDLLNRIRAYTITLPPLRERLDDIHMLSVHLLELLCAEYGARRPRTIHKDAMDKLMTHGWNDGNVRELRNVFERVVKDNKDSEIVVARDIRFDETAVEPRVLAKVETIKGSLDDSKRDWQTVFKTFSIGPDYASLHGTWPLLQRGMAFSFAGYLASAIEATRKRHADGPPEGEINLTGAVSCLLGQQVSTIKAADFIKRLLQFDEKSLPQVFKEHPALEEAYNQALRFRPKRNNKAGVAAGDAV